MKKKILSALFLAAFISTTLAAKQQTTITGVLTDDMCTKKHMMPGKPNADCVRECIKHGAKFVIVSSGKVVAVSGNTELLIAHAGKKVTLTGEVKGETFAVSSVDGVQ
jgi:hypothetical protein